MGVYYMSACHDCKEQHTMGQATSIGRIDGTLNLRNFIQNIDTEFSNDYDDEFSLKVGNTKKLKLNLREWNYDDE
jgi:hypothetical protein